MVLLLTTVAACALPGGAGTFSPAPAPSEAEAIAYLDEVVRIVRAGELDRLCELGGGTCRRSLEDGASSVPRTAPRLVGTVEVPSTPNADGTWNAGGRLLQLCGVDGLGAPYYSEILVFEDAGRLIGREPVFWTGITIATLPAVVGPASPRPCPTP